MRIFKKWEGKIDKKTATFEDGCYFGHERRFKPDAIIESFKINGVECLDKSKYRKIVVENERRKAK